jgi:hypothetical protein
MRLPHTRVLISLAALALACPRSAPADEPATLESLAHARRAEMSRPWREWRARMCARAARAQAAPGGPSRPGAAALSASRRAVTVSFPPANVRINDPAGDSAGVAQVSPSNAALGSNVLCAFTDGQGLVRPVGGVGFAWSTDAGLSYTDGGAPPAPPGWSWSGRPALAADPAGPAIYLVARADSDAGDPSQAWSALVTVSAGFPAPGAPVWGTPHVAARTAGSSGLLDQPALAADPIAHTLDLVCVHYTAQGSGVEFRASQDQGASWSAPVTLSGPLESGAVAGPRVVDLPGAPARVTVAWLSAGAIDADAYRVRSSPDGGASWDPAITACSAFHAFGSGPPGSNRGASTDFPALALDTAPSSAHRGRLYLAWQESVNFYGDTLYFSPPLTAAPAAEAEPDDDAAHATPFAIGQTLRGALAPGDQDWFAFAGSQGQTVVLLADSLDVTLEESMRLLCSDGATRLAYSAPGAGAGYGGEIVFTLSETGTYYLRLAEPPTAAGAGGYRVRSALHRPAAGRARDHRDIFASHSDDGLSWSAPVLISDDPPRFDDTLPELAVDGNGVAYAEWMDWRDAPAGTCGGVSHTYLARSANGGDVFTSFGAVSDAPSAWSGISSNLSPDQGDRLALYANDSAVYPAWTDGRSGDPEIEGVTLSLSYLVTPTLISLLRADAEPQSITLSWYEAGSLEAALLEQRIEPGDWRTLATLAPDGEGFLAYVDRGVPAGAMVHYRLALLDSPGGPWFGAVDVRVPGAATFALEGVAPNPMTRSARVRFSLDGSAPAALEMLDTAGRRVAFAQVGTLGAGAHIVELVPHAALAPGLYLVKLTQGPRFRVARAVVIR